MPLNIKAEKQVKKQKTFGGKMAVIKSPNRSPKLSKDKFHKGSESTARWSASIKPKNSAIKTPKGRKI